jgi:hypothetical protein
MKNTRRVFSWQLLSLSLVGMSACSTTPQQIYSRSNLEPGQALMVIGVVHKGFWPHGRIAIVLHEYSPETEKTTATCFYEQPLGPPESATTKYYVYRVPGGIYTVSLDVFSPPNGQAFVVPRGQAMYIGDLATVGNSGRLELTGDLAAAQNEVAENAARQYAACEGGCVG